MAKRIGSKGSRSERRAGRQRAERAREHGLPVSERREAQLRARAATPEPLTEADDAERAVDGLLPTRNAGIPTVVKVVGIALLILVGVFFLGRARDRALTETPPATEPSASAATVEASSAGVEPAPGAPVVETPQDVGASNAPLEPPPAVPSIQAPTKPAVARPSVPRAIVPKAAPVPLPTPVAAPVEPKAPSE